MKTKEAREKAVKTLNELINGGDNEIIHVDADDALVEFLKEIGETEVAQAYESLREKREFWYA